MPAACAECVRGYPSGSPQSADFLPAKLGGRKPKPPSMPEKFVSAMKAVREFVRSGGEILNGDSVAARISACDLCDQKTSFIGRPVCGACGCFIQLKAKLPHEHCPLQKWPGDPPAPPGGCGSCGGGSGAASD